MSLSNLVKWCIREKIGLGKAVTIKPVVEGFDFVFSPLVACQLILLVNPSLGQPLPCLVGAYGEKTKHLLLKMSCHGEFSFYLDHDIFYLSVIFLVTQPLNIT